MNPDSRSPRSVVIANPERTARRSRGAARAPRLESPRTARSGRSGERVRKCRDELVARQREPAARIRNDEHVESIGKGRQRRK